MIADYVNDQIDVVSKAFLGIIDRLRSLPRPQVRPDLDRGLLRPGRHLLQHAADPRSRRRQYPARPRAASFADELKKDRGPGRRRQEPPGRARAAASRRGRPCLCRLSSPRDHGKDRSVSSLRPVNTGRHPIGSQPSPWRRLPEQQGLDEKFLAGFIDYLGRVAAQPSIDRHHTLRDAAAGTLAGPLLEESAAALAKELAALAARKAKSAPTRPARTSLHDACLIRFRADDPHLRHRRRRPRPDLAQPGWLARPTPGRSARRAAP